MLQLLAGELTEREIGAELLLSRNTVHTHVTAIYRKLGVASRSDARAPASSGRSGRSGSHSPR
jgi:LuxR family transcriptional regulator, maltose regulon positive regulatory protein